MWNCTSTTLILHSERMHFLLVLFRWFSLETTRQSPIWDFWFTPWRNVWVKYLMHTQLWCIYDDFHCKIILWGICNTYSIYLRCTIQRKCYWNFGSRTIDRQSIHRRRRWQWHRWLRKPVYPSRVKFWEPFLFPR